MKPEVGKVYEIGPKDKIIKVRVKYLDGANPEFPVGAEQIDGNDVGAVYLYRIDGTHTYSGSHLNLREIPEPRYVWLAVHENGEISQWKREPPPSPIIAWTQRVPLIDPRKESP